MIMEKNTDMRLFKCEYKFSSEENCTLLYHTQVLQPTDLRVDLAGEEEMRQERYG